MSFHLRSSIYYVLDVMLLYRHFTYRCIMSFVGVYFVVAGKGTVEVVVQATKTEPAPVTVTTNIFPCK